MLCVFASICRCFSCYDHFQCSLPQEQHLEHFCSGKCCFFVTGACEVSLAFVLYAYAERKIYVRLIQPSFFRHYYFKQIMPVKRYHIFIYFCCFFMQVQICIIQRSAGMPDSLPPQLRRGQFVAYLYVIDAS